MSRYVKSNKVAGSLPSGFRVAALFGRYLCHIGFHKHQLPAKDSLTVNGVVVGERMHWCCARCQRDELTVLHFINRSSRRSWESVGENS